MNKEPKRKAGKPAITAEQKKARDELLKNETITARTKRVLEPRIKRILKQLDALNKAVSSPRYYFTDDVAENVIEALNKRFIVLSANLRQTNTEDKEENLF